MKIGLISDTHGLVRPQALAALAGAARIIHAGDIGGREVVEMLQSIAPVAAVRGNNDQDRWGRRLPPALTLELGGLGIHVLHDLNELEEQAAAGCAVVVSGHSHKPAISERGGVLFVNPGSAGPRRFSLPVTLAWLEISAGRAQARIQPLL